MLVQLAQRPRRPRPPRRLPHPRRNRPRPPRRPPHPRPSPRARTRTRARPRPEGPRPGPRARPRAQAPAPASAPAPAPKAPAPAPAPKAPAPPPAPKAPAPKTQASSGDAKKTSGAKDLARDGRHRRGGRREPRVRDGLLGGRAQEGGGEDGKKHKTTDEVDDVDKLPMLQQRIPVHKKIAPLFTEIFEKDQGVRRLQAHPNPPWSPNARQNRNNPTQWSIHSWGTLSTSTPRPTRTSASPATRASTPRQRPPEIVAKHFTSRGFVWLDDFDAMHFQYHVGGAPSITEDEIAENVADDKRKEKDKTYSGTSSRSLAADTKRNLKLAAADRRRAEEARPGQDQEAATQAEDDRRARAEGEDEPVVGHQMQHNLDLIAQGPRRNRAEQGRRSAGPDPRA